MNVCSIIENYSYSKTISEIELDFLEEYLSNSINKINLNSLPSFAPAMVCSELNLPQGSTWLTCNSVILDTKRPLVDGMTRAESLTSLLFSANSLQPLNKV